MGKISRAFVAVLVFGAFAIGSVGPPAHGRIVEDELPAAKPPTVTIADVPAAPFATTKTFKLHSRSTATRKIYLDFNGHTLSGTWWNEDYTGNADVTMAGFSLDGSRSFNTEEHAVIQRTWLRIAEDYAPFNVDVTTEPQAVDKLTKTSSSDTAFGVRVLFSPTCTWYSNPCPGGVAYHLAFGGSKDLPALVFTHNTLSGVGDWNDMALGEAGSHEIGHTFDLYHDGKGSDAYYSGHGQWAPIMGLAYNKPVTQWSKGEYTGATRKEDDLARIAKLAPYRSDDYANTASSTTTIAAGSKKAGAIGRTGDKDVFKFTLSAQKKVTITVAPNAGPVSSNLNTQLELWKSGQSSPSARSSPTDKLSSSITKSLAAGTYYAFVSGVGQGTASTGWSAYGSLGRYMISLKVA